MTYKSLIIGLICAANLFAFAATINVPSDYATIQEAIDASSAGDTIVVADGFVADDSSQNSTLLDNGSKARLVITKGITLRSVSGTLDNPVYICGRKHSTSEDTVVTNLGPNSVRALYLKTPAGEKAHFKGIAFINGCTGSGSTNYYGAGVWCDGCAESPVFEDCVVSNNVAYTGGGIYADIVGGGFAYLTNCLITANAVTYSAGGTYKCSCYRTTISHNKVTGNSNGSAPAAARYGDFIECQIIGNARTSTGNEQVFNQIIMNGGVLKRCLFKDNRGGGSRCHGLLQVSEIRDCDFVNNKNSVNGMISDGTKVLYNCRFYGKNSNPCIFGVGFTLYNCIITNNINVSTATPFFKDSNLYNCIISNNRHVKSTNKSQANYYSHLSNCKLYNCTFRVTKFSREYENKAVGGNEIYGCVLVNTVFDVFDEYGTSSWMLGPCGNLYATNSCLPEVFVLSNALKGASNNIYYGAESECKKTGLITEGDKQYQLNKGSVCIDSGWDGKSENNPAGFAYLKSSDANEFYGIDYFGSKRISGKAVDIGASERAIPGFTIRVR